MKTLSLSIAILLVISSVYAQTCVPNNVQQLPGAAIDIAVDPNGNAWAIGTNQGIYRWKEDQFAWEQVNGAGIRVTVCPGNVPWHVNSANKIYRWVSEGKWTEVTGLAVIDVACGADGSVWAIGTDHFIYKWAGENSWTNVRPGSQLEKVAVDPSGNPWVIGMNNLIFKWENDKFNQIAGTAFDIGIGADGTVWVTGLNGYVYRWDTKKTAWVAGNGQGTWISVGPNGAAWIVGEKTPIYRQVSQRWTQLPGAAQDIGVGADGTVYVVGMDSLVSGGGVFRYQHKKNDWNRISDIRGAARVSVDQNGNPWIVDASNNIWQWDSKTSKFVQLPSAATDIGVGPDGSVWTTGVYKTQEVGYVMRFWNAKANAWQNVGGAATRITVGKDGVAYHINSLGKKYIWRGGDDWSELSNSVQAVDIAAGADGSLWITAKEGGIYKYASSSNTWVQIDGSAVNIATGPNGLPWVTGSKNDIWKRVDDCTSFDWPEDKSFKEDTTPTVTEVDNIVNTYNYWEQMPGSTQDIAVSPEGTIWAVGTNQGLYYFDEDKYSWVQVPGAGIRIAVGPKNTPYHVNSAGAVYKWVGKDSWSQIGSGCVDVGAGADGSVFVVTSDGSVYEWINDQTAWSKLKAPNSQRISVDSLGRPWVIAKDNGIWKWVESGFVQVPGAAFDVGVSETNVVFVIGTDRWNYRYSYKTNNWVKGTGSGLTGVAVKGDRLYCSTNTGNTYRQISNRWVQLPGAGKDIGVGADGSVWVVGTDSIPGGSGLYKYQFKSNNWQRQSSVRGASRVSVDPNGNPYYVDNGNHIFYWDSKANQFVQLPSAATDIGVGPDGSVWVVGVRQTSSTGNLMRRWDAKAQAWIDVGGAAVRIAVGPKGLAYHVNNKNEIYRWKGGDNWDRLSGAALDIGVGADGTVWVTGSNQGVYKYYAASDSWQQIDASGCLQIAVDPKGFPYVITKDNAIFQRRDDLDATPSNSPIADEADYTYPVDTDNVPSCNQRWWEQIPGSAIDVAVGPEGNVWVIGSNQGIYTFDENKFTWNQIPGAGVRVSVGPKNTAYHVNSAGNIYRYLGGGSWQQIEGPSAADIGAGPEGSLWITGKDGAIYEYLADQNAWNRVPGGASRISVDTSGRPWVIGGSNTIWRWQTNQWIQVAGSAIDVAVGADNTVWVVGTNRVNYRWSYKNKGWTAGSGSGLDSIAADPNGVLYCVTTGQAIYRQKSLYWLQVPGAARDVAAGADGSVYVIGTDNLAGGGGVYKYQYSSNNWFRISSFHGGARISVDPNGNPYICDSSNLAFRWDSKQNRFLQLPSGCTDIGVGSDGTVWAVGTVTSSETGNLILRYNEKKSAWDVVPGAAWRIAGGLRGGSIHINLRNEIYETKDDDTNSWNRMPGAANDVGIGADGTRWVVGSNSGIYRYVATSNQWVQIDGSANAITVDNYGSPWVIGTSGGAIFRRYDECATNIKRPADSQPTEAGLASFEYKDSTGSCQVATWEQFPGAARDIAVGPEGDIWVIGTNEGIYTYDEGKANWNQIPGAGVRIAVGPGDTAWHVNSAGLIYQYQGSNNWKQINAPKTADVGVGAEGSVWIVAADNSIWKWDPTQNYFVKYPGGAYRISVDAYGNPWVIGGSYTIWRWNDNQWIQMPGNAYDIAVGADNTVWVVGTNGINYRWNFEKKSWIQGTGSSLSNIASGPDGVAHVIGGNNGIWRQSANKWTQIPGAAVDIAIGAEGSVFHVGLAPLPGGGTVYRWQFNKRQWTAFTTSRGATKVAVNNKGWPVIIDNANKIWRFDSTTSQFTQLPETANDLGCGPDGSCWIVGTQNTGNGYALKYLDEKTTSWVTVHGAATRVAVGPKGISYHVNSQNNIYQWQGGNTWKQLAGSALDISIGAEGSLWVTGTDQGIYKYNFDTNSWGRIDGAATQIAVDNNGMPWVVNSAQNMFQRTNDCKPNTNVPADTDVVEVANVIVDADAASDCNKNYWEQIPGGLLDVAVGPEGNVWCIGTNQGIYYWTEKTYQWTQVPGGAVRIAVGPNNTPYVVNSGGGIYKWNGNNGWNQLSGAALDIGVGADGTVWVIGTDQGAYQYIPASNTWSRFSGATGIRISVDKNGRPWIVSSNTNIFRYQGASWKQVNGAAYDVTVGADSSVFVIGTDRNVWDYSYKDQTFSKIETGGLAANIAVSPSQTVYISGTNNGAYRRTSRNWVDLSGAAQDIGAGVDGTVFVVGKENLPAGGGVWRYQHTANAWTRLSDYHGASKVAVDPNGNPWIVDQNSLIWAWDNNNNVFVNVPGAANDIGIGADGSVWVIGIQGVGGGYNIRKYDASTRKFTTIPGGAVRIAVQPNGNPWVINNGNSIYRWLGERWEQLPGGAYDVGVGADGTVYVAAGGLYRWYETNKYWAPIYGRSANQVSVDGYGNPWTVDSSGKIARLVDECNPVSYPEDNDAKEKNPFKQTLSEPANGPQNWQGLVGAAIDIGSGVDGDTWVIGTDQGIYQWVEEVENWSRYGGAGVRITVGNKAVVHSNSGYNLYIDNGKTGWKQLPGSVFDVALNADNQLFGVGLDYQIWQYQPDQNSWNRLVSWQYNAIRLAVDPAGNPWIVATTGQIARWLGNQWQTLPGAALDITCGHDGAVWVAGTNGINYRWDWKSSDWAQGNGGSIKTISANGNGLIWATLSNNAITRTSTYRWRTLTGAANDIGVGADGSVYVIGKDQVPGGNGVWRYIPSKDSWARISDYHGAVAVAADKDGNPWIVDASQNVLRWVSETNTFKKLPDGANDIAAGADGSVWIIGVTAVGGGYNIRKWDESKKKWSTITGGAVRIAVDQAGNPWVTNSNNDIFSWNGERWTQIGGKAIDVGVGADGTVWVVGTNNILYRWADAKKTWIQTDGVGYAVVSVDARGNPWGVTPGGAIKRRTNDAVKEKLPEVEYFETAPATADIPDVASGVNKNYYEQIPGAAIDIAISPEGYVWVMGTDQGIYQWSEAQYSWNRAPGAAVRVAVGPSNTPWVVNSGNNIYKWTGSNWRQVAGAAFDIGVGSEGSVWVVGTDNNLYNYLEEENSWKKYKTPSQAIRVSVDKDGNPYYTDKNNGIYRWFSNQWYKLDGAGIDIACSKDGTAVVVGTDNNPWQYIYSSKTFTKRANVPNGAVNVALNPIGEVWVTDKQNNIWRASGLHNVKVEGAASDVGVGADGTVFVVGTEPVKGGNGVWRYSYETNKWSRISDYHGAKRIAVGPNGAPWIVDSNNFIYRWDVETKTFVQLPGAANDIGVSSNGKVWVIGIQSVGGGFNIRYWDSNKQTWVTIPGGAVRIAVDNEGLPWVVNVYNDIFRHNGKNWDQIAGKALDIGCGSEGSVWVVGTDGNLYDRNFASNNWIRVSGSAQQIAVDPTGQPWFVSADGTINRRLDDAGSAVWPKDANYEGWTEGNPKDVVEKDPEFNVNLAGWAQLPGAAIDIAVGPEGNVWVMGTDQGIYTWNNAKSNWDRISGAGVRVAVGPKNTAYHVNSGNNIYIYLGGNSWKQLPGAAKDVGAGADGSLWVVGTDNKLYEWNEDQNTWNQVNSKNVAKVSVDKNGNPWVTLNDNSIARWIDNALFATSGLATDIAVGADGSVVVTGMDSQPWRYSYASKQWSQLANGQGAGASQIAVGPSGVIFYTAKDNAIWTQSSVAWRAFSGSANDVAVGADGSLWVIGSDELDGGYGVYRFNRAKKSWDKLSELHGGIRVAADAEGLPWIVDSYTHIWTWDKSSNKLVQVKGNARDIGVGADGTVWIIGVVGVGGGYQILRRNADGGWDLIPGGAVRIAVNPRGLAWVVNNGGNIYKYTGSGWNQIYGTAYDIGIGADGTVFHVGTSSSLWRWDAASSTWSQVLGQTCTQVSVDPNGFPYVVGTKGEIVGRVDTSVATKFADDFALKDNNDKVWGADTKNRLKNWEQLPGAALDIGAGPEDSVWVTGTDQGIYEWNNAQYTWRRGPGAAVKVAVAPKNVPWVVNAGRNIYYLQADGNWRQLPGAALDVAVGADGSAFVVGTDNGVYEWVAAESNWVRIGKDKIAARIAVDAAGRPWVTAPDNSILRWNGWKWSTITGAATDIGVGADGSIWVVGTDNRAWKWSEAKQDWSPLDGTVNQLSVAGSGLVYAVGPKNVILRQSALKWVSVKGSATQIAASQAGSIWIVDSKERLYSWDPAQSDWVSLEVPSGGILRTAVDIDGTPFVIGRDNNVYKRIVNKWKDIKTQATEIALGGGQIWILGTDKVKGGFQVYQRVAPTEPKYQNVYTWTKSPLGAVKIAATPQGLAWAIDSNNYIWRFDGKTWNQVSGAATSISVGSDGTIWVVGTDGNLYRWIEGNSSWIRLEASAVYVSADRNGLPWIIDTSGKIWRRVDDLLDDEKAAIIAYVPVNPNANGETDADRQDRFAREAAKSITIAGFATKSLQGTPLATISDNARWADFSVDFSYTFDEAPVVAVGLTGFLLANGPTAGIAVFPVEVTATGFTYRVYVPAGSEAYGVRVSWLATNRDTVGVTYILVDHNIDGDVESSMLNGPRGERVIKREVDHPVDLYDPQAVVGLAGFSFDDANKLNPRLEVSVDSVDITSVNVKFRVWWDTKLFGALAVIVHYEKSPFQGVVEAATDYNGALFNGSGDRKVAQNIALTSQAGKKHVAFPVLSLIDLEHTSPYRLLEDWSVKNADLTLTISTSGTTGIHLTKDKIFFVHN